MKPKPGAERGRVLGRCELEPAGAGEQVGQARDERCLVPRMRRDGEPPRLAFEHARFVVGAEAWARALAPHSRDRASFIPELQPLLEASGRLEVVAGDRSATLGPAYRLHFSDGHTPGLMLVEVPGETGPIVFAADLIPGAPWVHLPITMGYDRYPELLIDEKKALLERIVAENGWAFFTHDPEIAAARIARDAKGRYEAIDKRAALA